MPRKPFKPGSVPVPHTSRTMSDVLMLPEPLRQLATWMLQHDVVSLEEVASRLEQTTEQVRPLLDTLVGQGFTQIQEHEGVPHYRMRLISRRKRQAARDLWQALDEKLPS